VRRLPGCAAGAIVVCLVLGLCPSALAAGPLPVAESVPYSDARATGFVALYDSAGQQMTHGSIRDRPFAAAAVGSAAAPSDYAGSGRTASLAMINPVQGQDAAQWSGDTVTGSTTYPDAGHPTAYASPGDYSLADWLTEYQPHWDGFVQLRLLLGAPEHSTLTTSYAASDIRITGGTWAFVRAEGPDGISAAAPPAAAQPRALQSGLAAAVAAQSARPAPLHTQGAPRIRPPTATVAHAGAASAGSTPPAVTGRPAPVPARSAAASSSDPPSSGAPAAVSGTGAFPPGDVAAPAARRSGGHRSLIVGVVVALVAGLSAGLFARRRRTGAGR